MNKKGSDARQVSHLIKNPPIIKTYEIINYIGWCLGETVDYAKIDSLFKDYGFNLSEYKLDYE